jgi:hypothetical protein
MNTKPTRFFLKDLQQSDKPQTKPNKKATPKDDSFNERGLHPLLTYFLYTKYRIYTKTILHETSPKKEFSQWQHPDIVGVSYYMENWKEEVYDIVNFTGNQPIKIYSYELKKELSLSNLRESYFQAVSNSSWANEGYLVAAKIDLAKDFMNEITRLSNSFGIGLISLDTKDPDNSKILLQARQKDILDIEMMNKMGMNPNFRDFLKRIKNDLANKEIIKEKYDQILSREELIKKYN